MTYIYDLTKQDLINMGLQPTDAEKYFVERSGWTGFFNSIYEVVIREGFGECKGKKIIDWEDITDEQVDYIEKNCPHKEYMWD